MDMLSAAIENIGQRQWISLRGAFEMQLCDLDSPFFDVKVLFEEIRDRLAAAVKDGNVHPPPASFIDR